MLTTFGIFWAAEGAGARWPGSDAALLAILGFVSAVVGAARRPLLRRQRRGLLAAAGAEA